MNADIFPAVSKFIPKVINTFVFILKSMPVFQRTFPCYKWIKPDNKKVTSYCIFNCDDSNTDLEDITKTILYHLYLKHSLNGCPILELWMVKLKMSFLLIVLSNLGLRQKCIMVNFKTYHFK